MSTESGKEMEVAGKEINLPSGKVAVIVPFKGKHVREAQRIAGGDVSNIMFAMISLTTSIDGNPILMEDMDEMDGSDVLALMGEFGGSL
jgi:hypothetical protein